MNELINSDLRLTSTEADAKCPTFILIMAAEPAASDVANHLRRALRVEVEVSADWSQCRGLLHQNNFALILLEESLASADSATVDFLYASQRDGWILEANFGVSGPERILRQVRAALNRKARNEAHTRTAVLHSVRNHLTSCLTGLLLESQLALRKPGADAAPALERIVGLAERLFDLVQNSGE